MRRTFRFAFLLALGPALAAPVRAQDSLAIAPGFDAARWLEPDAPLEFTLSRALEAGEGRLALIVGDLDVSSMVAVNGVRVTYEPRAVRLPGGESEAFVYLAAADGSWKELGRFPLRVLRAGGLERSELTPRLAVQNKGQLAEGHAPENNRPPRSEFQDFTLNLGFQSAHAARGWQLQSQTNLIGVSNRQEALRFGELGTRAARVDLSDYAITLERGAVSLTTGQIGIGAHRHLLNGFQSRGVATSLRIAPAARLQLGGMSSSALVGWSNLLGISRSNHRVLAANLTLDLVPGTPGLIQLDASALHGNALPVAGFAQAVVTDAERSRGGGIRVQAALPSQRIRLDAGYARSRFTNPFDPTLAQGDSIVPVAPVTRAARYLDLNIALVRGALSPALPASVGLVFRHERVDPLYRTVANAQVRADLLQDAVELLAGIGAATLRLSHMRGHDNLDRIGTILGTQTRASAAGLDLPLAMIFGASVPAWLPVLSYALTRTHQFGDSVPRAGGFPDSFVPDQVSLGHSVGAQLQGQVWRLALRADQSRQDNRQVGRENADFRNRAGTLSLGLNPRPAFDVTIDLTLEHARSEERDQENTTRRVGTNLSWRVTTTSTVSGGVAGTWTSDEPKTLEQQASELRVELAQRFNVPGGVAARGPGQLFLRYSRQFGEQLPLGVAALSRRSWALNTGASLTLF